MLQCSCKNYVDILVLLARASTESKLCSNKVRFGYNMIISNLKYKYLEFMWYYKLLEIETWLGVIRWNVQLRKVNTKTLKSFVGVETMFWIEISFRCWSGWGLSYFPCKRNKHFNFLLQLLLNENISHKHGKKYNCDYSINRLRNIFLQLK